MIAGLLALTLLSADTTMRISPPVADTLVESCVIAADTTVLALPQPSDSLSVRSVGPMLRSDATDSTIRLQLPRADTTIRKKRALVEYSDWYGRRLKIHKTLSWAMMPLFAVSYYTGEQLLSKGRFGAPRWVRDTHPWVAAADAGIFGINTVTGLWNLWDSRRDPNGRTKRIIHATLFVIADAGFAYAGVLGKQARDDSSVENRHRAVALSSIGVSTISWLIMLIGQ